MTIRPILIVEDDPFPHMLRAYLDPDTGRSESERLKALAYYLAHDMPDFDGWLKKLRALEIGRAHV